jgi:hypothetical protein|tara:strand:- start:710 stop:934 length:225 start_codon:yes stop_codon:yes gene_type:complete
MKRPCGSNRYSSLKQHQQKFGYASITPEERSFVKDWERKYPQLSKRPCGSKAAPLKKHLPRVSNKVMGKWIYLS